MARKLMFVRKGEEKEEKKEKKPSRKSRVGSKKKDKKKGLNRGDVVFNKNSLVSFGLR